MKCRYTLSYLFLFFFYYSHAQLSLQDGSSSYLINFDASVSGVNSGAFLGSGFTTNPSNGQLDADAWATSGLSDGAKDFGVANSTGDHARGANDGGVSTGGCYGFDIGGGNRAIGIQPTGSDWTPGTITLKISNNSTSVINDMDIDYNIYVRNDQGRANTFNFSYSFNNSSYVDAIAGNYTSPAASTGTTWVVNNRTIILGSLGLNPGEDFYIRWSGSDAGGSGSRDEFALDDISITATGSTNSCVEPTSQASNLTFGTVTSNSIQATFTGGTADKYLAVKSTNPSLGASPSDGVIYTVGSNLGNGEVLQFSNSSSINALGLTNNTLYYFYVFAANDNCAGGPDYLSTNPLVGSISTQQNGNSNYYSSIGNETCANLKTALHNLIDGHTSVSYSSLWTHYQTTDDHLNDSGNEIIVWDMYSDNPTGGENEFTFVAEQCGSYQGEGDCYNREHSFPKSWWGGSTSVPQYTDLFTVVPVDGWINGIRNNNPYGEVQSGTETHITGNGSRLGTSSTTIPGYSGSVFEPIDAYKGDLARGYFYMATRYEDVIAGWENYNTESDAVLDGTSYEVFEPWMLNMLMSWHNNDPVDQKEIDRNESIYGIQGNRNPFIDHPEYVALIWSNCTGGDTQSPTNPTNLTASNTTETTTDLTWNSSTDNVGVTGYNIYQDGVNVFSVTNTNATVNGLSASTTYSFYVTAFDAAGNESGGSAAVSVTTSSSVDTQSPTNPTNLTASNTTETTTDLTWNSSTDNVGVTGYNIYQDGVNVFSVTNTNATVNGLSASTTYSFYVTAFDAAGNESGSSAAVSVTTSSPPSSVVLHEGYFESGWDGWSDGGSDCARYSGSNSSEGNYSIRIRDNSNTSSSMTSPTFDLSSYSSVDFDFSFIARSMENNEDFWVRYNDGSGWQTVATFARGTDFNNSTFYNISLNLNSSQYNFSNNGTFRIQCDASGNNDRVYIDEVVITGNIGNSALIAPVISELFQQETSNKISRVESENTTLELDENKEGNPINIFPNPVIDILNITNFKGEGKIYDLSGRLVFEFKLSGNEINSIDVSRLSHGIYQIIFVKNNGELVVKRFMK